MSIDDVPGAHKMEEESRRSETINQVLADKRQRALFARFLNSYPEDDDLVQDIYHRYEAKEGFTEDQIKLLAKRLPGFRERLALAEEARQLFGREAFTDAARHHELLGAILSQSTHAAELLRRRLAAMAMEDPDALRTIMDRQRTINEKKRTARQRTPDDAADLMREIDGLQRETAETISVFAAADEEFMRDLIHARLRRERGDTEHEEDATASVSEDEQSWQKTGKDVLVAVGTLAGEAVLDQWGLWKGMLGALASHAIGVGKDSPKGGSGEQGRREKKKRQKEEKESDHKDEPPMSREEFFGRFSQLVDDEDFNAAKELFEKHHAVFDELKGVSKKILKLLQKRQHAEARDLLEKVLVKGEGLAEEE